MEQNNILKDSEVIRVLHVIRTMNMAGAETLIMNLYRNIDRTKVQFDFLVSGDGDFDKEIISLGGKIHQIPYITEVGQFKYVNELKKFLNSHNEYKIIHSHIDQVTGIILETANKCGVPVRIAHSHSTKNSNGILAKIYKLYLQSKINKNATDLFACSKDAAKWLYKEMSPRAVIINNGINLEKFKFSKEKRNVIRKELNIPDNYTVIGHVGAFRKEKNHKFLIDVYNEYFKINSNSYLVLVGDGILRKEIEEKVKALKLENNVKFLGARNDTHYLYSAFDVFCFPSLYEGLPLTLVEAQTSGLKCLVGSNISKEANILRETGFLELKNIFIWVEELKRVKNNRIDVLDKKISEFDIKKISNKLMEIYIRILSVDKVNVVKNNNCKF